MKYIIYTFVLLILFSCNKGVLKTFDYNKSSNPWISAFKDQVFVSSLREAYKTDSTILQRIEKKDAFNPYDGLNLDELNEAKRLGKELIINMPAPSMCESCKNDENYYMATSLHYYNSIELNKIAKKLYRKHVSNDL